MADEVAGATIITFGKCAGLTFADVRQNDPSYCNWVLSLPRPTGALVAFRDYLQQYQAPVAVTASPPRPSSRSQPQASPSTPAKRSRAEDDRPAQAAGSPSQSPAQSSRTVLTQSKYKGKTYGWILRHKPDFCRWALGRALKTAPMRDFQRWLKEHAVAEAEEGRYDLVGEREGDEVYDDENESDEFDDGDDDEDDVPLAPVPRASAGGAAAGGGPTPDRIALRGSPAGPAAGSAARPGRPSEVIDLVAPPSHGRGRGSQVVDLVGHTGPAASSARASGLRADASATGSPASASPALPKKSTAAAPARPGSTPSGASGAAATAAAAAEELERIRAELAALRASQEAALEEKLCSICMEGEKRIAFQCGHRVCKECSPRVSDCPYCKKRITKRINLY